jgi:uncharacterized protein (DUF302 family)
MKLNIFPKLLGTFLLTIVMASTVVSASTLTELQGTKGLAEADLKAMIGKLDSIKFKSIFKKERVDNKYYKKFKERNLDLISFYTVTDLITMHELLIANPDFAAYAPFNLLAYKNLEKAKDGNITWYGHLATKTMLYIIGEKDKALREKFEAMVAKLDTLVKKELKPTESQKITFDKPLPEIPLMKMVKDISDVDDIEDYVEEFIMEHDSLFVENKFVLAGFSDFKVEYEDLDLEFDEYDAFWISSACHFKFSNTIFNRGLPQAGVFAPCTVYFYVPKGSGKLHVGYAKIENWIPTTGVTDKEKIANMKKTSALMVKLFGELGFK